MLGRSFYHPSLPPPKKGCSPPHGLLTPPRTSPRTPPPPQCCVLPYGMSPPPQGLFLPPSMQFKPLPKKDSVLRMVGGLWTSPPAPPPPMGLGPGVGAGGGHIKIVGPLRVFRCLLRGWDSNPGPNGCASSRAAGGAVRERTGSAPRVEPEMKGRAPEVTLSGAEGRSAAMAEESKGGYSGERGVA